MLSPSLKILAAAKKRFSDYGYHKTTIAEIATDAGMSVGNVYRHFSNKSAIAAAGVTHNLQEKLEYGLQAADKEKTCCAKLTAFLVARLRFSHHFFKNHRHLHECVGVIHAEHQHVLKEAENRIIEAMTVFLQQGMIAEQVQQGNAQHTAYLIHQAMMRYNYPMSLKNNALAVLEKDLRATLKLFYQGLAC